MYPGAAAKGEDMGNCRINQEQTREHEIQRDDTTAYSAWCARNAPNQLSS